LWKSAPGRVCDGLPRFDPDQPDPARIISNAITIAIEKPIRINRTLIFFFQPDRDGKFFSRV
jgi:hypothetical protein